MKRFISLCLSLLLILQVGIVGLQVVAEDVFVTFEDHFDYDSFTGSLIDDSGIWQKEYKTNTMDDYGYAEPNAPSLSANAVSFAKGSGLRLNWQKIPGFAVFDATKVYTITFDAVITSKGDDTPYQTSALNRELYFAPGGYYNQIEFQSNNGIRAGDATTDYPNGGWNKDSSVYVLNSVYSCTVKWVPASQAIITTIKSGDTLIREGIRTNASYATLNKYTRSFVWRCEDGAMTMDNFVFTDGTTTYTQDFSFSGSMLSAGIWGIENVQKTDATASVVSDGVLHMTETNSVQFNWTNVPNVGAYDASKTYTFEFDAKMTDKGDGSIWGTENYTRALYVAMGGWWNLIELPNRLDNLVLCGGANATCDDATYLNQTIHFVIQWEGTTISVVALDAAGNMLLSSSRSNTSFTDMSANTGAMTNLVLRCEDGAVDIDNFVFKTSKTEKVSSLAVQIPENQQATYTSNVTYDGASSVRINYGNGVLFSIAPTGMSVGTKGIQGSFGTGNYAITAQINPTQEMVSVEVITPDGSVVRRGIYILVGGDSIDVYANSADAVTNASVVYSAVTANEYTLTTTRPQATGFGVNVYNLVTSFDNAKTTRNFAWTALASFIGTDEMAVRYRVAGTEQWNTVDAVREVEPVTVDNEEYFKCDLTGLVAATEYEYQIGRKGSTSDWSEIYTFTTSDELVDDYSFVAVGDTQGMTWNGTEISNKGFMYAKAAIDEAFEANSNPAFMLHTGDVVEAGSNQDMWNMYFQALGGNGAKTPHFAAIGNHDTWINGGSLYFDLHFNHPNNGGTAALDQSQIANIQDANLQFVAQYADETIYSYDYGNTHFIVLNTGSYVSDDQYMLEAQRQWLINDLEANKGAQWTVMLIHQPVYHRLGGVESRPYLYDVIEGYGVDLVMQGHSHLVTRTYPMKDGKIAIKTSPNSIAQGTGTIYTTIGSTALNHDGISDANNMEEIFSMTVPTATQPAYTSVSVDGDKLVVTTKQVNGLVLDTFTINADAPIEEVQAVADTIDAIGEVTKDNYTQKAQLIVNAEADLAALVSDFGEASDDTIAQSVITLRAARTAYDQLVADQEAAKAVEDQIAALNVQSLDDEASVQAARGAYDGLTDAQKAYVTNLAALESAEKAITDLKAAAEQEAADKAAAKAVEDVIAGLTEKSDLFNDCDNFHNAGGTEIIANPNSGAVNMEIADGVAKFWYKADGTKTDLPMTVRSDTGFVPNDYQYLVFKLYLSEGMEVVVPAEGTWAGGINFSTAFGGIDAAEKVGTADISCLYNLVPGQWNTVVVPMIASDKVVKQICIRAYNIIAGDSTDYILLDDVRVVGANEITLDSKADVEAARAAYDALTDDQKALVGNVADLEAAEAKIVELEEAAAEAADQAAAKAVEDAIAALNVQSLGDKAAVEAARAAYDALTDAQKAKVTNLAALEAAEAKIVELEKAAQEDSENKAAADEVVAMIDALVVESLDDKAAVEAARTAYNALTEAQKAFVTNLAALEAAEDVVVQLEKAAAEAADQAAADEVSAKIAVFKTAANKKGIAAARAAYEALTDAQKALVTNLDRLEELENDARQVAEVTAMIDAIQPGDQAAISAARAAYNALTFNQKMLITNEARFVQLEMALQAGK